MDPGFLRRVAHPGAHFLLLFGGEPGGPPGVVAFRQAGQTVLFEAAHPIADRAWRVAEVVGNLFAAQAPGDHQDPVTAVIVAGVGVTVDLLLQHSAAELG